MFNRETPEYKRFEAWFTGLKPDSPNYDWISGLTRRQMCIIWMAAIGVPIEHVHKMTDEEYRKEMYGST